MGRTSDAIVLVSLIPSAVVDDRSGEDVSCAACGSPNGANLRVSLLVCFVLCIHTIKNTISAASKRPPTLPIAIPMIKLFELTT